MKQLISVLIIICCVCGVFGLPGEIPKLPFTFRVVDCYYTTRIYFYKGNGSEFKATSNNGTIPLEVFVTKSMGVIPSKVYLALTSQYQPPVILRYNNFDYDITIPNINCIYRYPPQLSDTSGETVNVSLVLSDPVVGESIDIYVDDVRNGSQQVSLNQESGDIAPFKVYFPYTTYYHNLTMVRVSKGISLFSYVFYTNPEINSIVCKRSYEVGLLVTNCNMTGQRLSEGIISNLYAQQYNGNLTYMNIKLLGNLLPSTPITINGKPTGAIFSPTPTTYKKTFSYETDSRGSTVIIIHGNYLDALNLSKISLKTPHSTHKLECSYSSEISILIGYLETLTCYVPLLPDYSDGSLILTSNNGEPISLTSIDIPYYHPSALRSSSPSQSLTKPIVIISLLIAALYLLIHILINLFSSI
ncbi:hypothetical protein CYY_005763 [Polysphondylium violaceum]|uniref:IPT/TIG domain-containing protein n=1 Tax=Polysphondylium violaceum TaxID=133409 RepID=A0A8J4PT99_9MYCE|nr:hypothetical protein CYY_005763 [Polysphondylium violaceum]